MDDKDPTTLKISILGPLLATGILYLAKITGIAPLIPWWSILAPIWILPAAFTLDILVSLIISAYIIDTEKKDTESTD